MAQVYFLKSRDHLVGAVGDRVMRRLTVLQSCSFAAAPVRAERLRLYNATSFMALHLLN
jgi:hypothetical protein